MFSSLLEKVRPVLVPHFIVNILLGLTFVIVKSTSPVCDYLFDDCSLELREWEWLTFLGCVIVVKTRKHDTYASYISTTCLFAKLLTTVMFFKHSILYAAVYMGLCMLHFVFLPAPAYEGPEFITYFRGPHLVEEVERDKRVSWLVAFYAAWSPPCVTFASIFSQISAEYHLDNLKFGKIDVSRYPQVAEKFKIDCSSWSKQLPTLILFKDGKENMRRPLTVKSRTLKFILTKENVIREFELNELYNQCRKNPLPSKKKEKKEQ